MSVWSIANKANDEEGSWASLAVQALQHGKDAGYYMEHAARCRAEVYEFTATGEIISPLCRERREYLRGQLGARA
jgi:hypothetical protein